MNHTIPPDYADALTAFGRYLEDDGKARRNYPVLHKRCIPLVLEKGK